MMSDDPEKNRQLKSNPDESAKQDAAKPSQGNRDPIRRFFEAVVTADIELLHAEYADMGANINVQQPNTLATALHYGAAYRSRRVIKWLIGFKELDYLVRDREGRLPSVLAHEVANDPVIGRFLAKKENEQARAQGVEIRTLLTP